MELQHVGRVVAMVGAWLLATLSGSAIAAPNLLANPGFTSDLTGWVLVFGRPSSWSALDASGNVSSGSVLIVNNQTGDGGTPRALVQCVAALPAVPYAFGGRARVPAGQPAQTSGQVYVQTFASDNCSGEALQLDTRGSVNVETWDLLSSEFVTGPTVHSILFTIGVFKPAGVTADAAANVDDVYLEQGAGPGGFTIGPSMSATWYNPAQSGHGIMVHLLNATSAWMCWFTFDLTGKRAWICALGTINSDTLDFAEAFVVEGGKFPPLFDPGAIVEVPWGSITVTFTSCDNGNMTWTTVADGFQSGSMPIARLTPLWGVPCP